MLAVFEAFNKRDWDAVVRAFAQDAVMNVMGTGQVFKGRDQIKGYVTSFVAASSDWKASDFTTYEDGDVVVVQGVGSGTNDRPFGPFPATGKPAAVPFCEIWQFNRTGEAVRNDDYVDQLGLLVQLGHLQAPGS